MADMQLALLGAPVMPEMPKMSDMQLALPSAPDIPEMPKMTDMQLAIPTAPVHEPVNMQTQAVNVAEVTLKEYEAKLKVCENSIDAMEEKLAEAEKAKIVANSNIKTCSGNLDAAEPLKHSESFAPQYNAMKESLRQAKKYLCTMENFIAQAKDFIKTKTAEKKEIKRNITKVEKQIDMMEASAYKLVAY
jgi:septal ring factor EnvC (AmiA/AmiB activator)